MMFDEIIKNRCFYIFYTAQFEQREAEVIPIEQNRLSVNDVILKEWERNKFSTISALTISIKNEYKSALNLANYFTKKIIKHI
jgi:hypothetical protein